MCVHAMAFEPAQVEGGDKIKCPVSTYQQRKVSHSRAEEFICQVSELWEPMLECENLIRKTLNSSKLRVQLNPLIREQVIEGTGRIGPCEKGV